MAEELSNKQLYDMIKEFKEDLKQDLGELKEDIKDVKHTVNGTTITLANHENRIKNLEGAGDKLLKLLGFLVGLGGVVIAIISLVLK